ncbi:MAG: RecB family exonuclease [Caldisericaceae bacterium]
MDETGFYLSHSKISTYIKCPLRYKFIYVDKMETQVRSYFSFGNSIHKVLEEFYNPLVTYNDLGKKPHQYLLELLDTHWISAGYGSPYQERKAKAEAQAILYDYCKKNINSFKPAYLVEKEFSFQLGGFEVKGRIDRIDKNDGKFAIVDYKTSSMMPKSFTEEEILQPVIYRIAAEGIIPDEADKISEVYLYFLRYQKKVNFLIDEHLIDKSKKRIIEIGNLIEKRVFYPKKNGYCSTCEFRSICPAFNENSNKEGL